MCVNDYVCAWVRACECVCTHLFLCGRTRILFFFARTWNTWRVRAVPTVHLCFRQSTACIAGTLE